MTARQPSVEISPLTDMQTVEALRPVLESTVVDPQTKQPIEAEIDAQLRELQGSVGDIDSPHFVARLNGKLVGVMGMQPFTPTDTYPNGWGKPAEVVHAHVDKNAQRTGIGSALLNHVNSIAANRGYDELAVPSGRWLRWGKDDFFRKTFDRMTFDDFDEHDSKPVWRKKLPEVEPVNAAQIIGLVHQTIPEFNTDDPILGSTDEDVLADNFEQLLKDPDATVITIEDESGKHRAFTLALPIGRFDTTRRSESDTAYIYITCVDPAVQHQGLAGSLMRGLHGALLSKGFRYIERDIMLDTGTGFADKVAKNYGDAIVESKQHAKWPELGKQRFFRIDLTKLPKN
jgi:GNAT superfamily N-acetyltransferase